MLLLIGDAWNYVGKVNVYDFGLGSEFIDQAETDFILIDDAMVHQLLPPIMRNRHKYQAGYVVGLGGSPGMPGAPIMSSFACLRAGAGIVRLLHPDGMEAELAFAPHEVIRQGYGIGDAKMVLEACARASAVFVGPGIGTGGAALKLLKKVLPQIDRPCVIDAEALTLIAHHQIALPPQTVMTPHHGEMKRLLGTDEDLPFPELLLKSQEYADKHHITLVLKGAPTFYSSSSSKTSSMCARGSGDGDSR